MNRSGGRPTKYKPEYCQQVIDFMAEGNSAIQFAVYLGVHKSTIYQWVQDYPEFSDAFMRAKEACESYWERKMQDAMFSRDANAQLFKYYFSNRFNWSDKQEHDLTSSDGTMSPKDHTAAVLDAIKRKHETKS